MEKIFIIELGKRVLGNPGRAIVSRKLELVKVTHLKNMFSSVIAQQALAVFMLACWQQMSYEVLSLFFFFIHKQAFSPFLQANFKGKPAGRENQGK